jgi:hypothetical protein
MNESFLFWETVDVEVREKQCFLKGVLCDLLNLTIDVC